MFFKEIFHVLMIQTIMRSCYASRRAAHFNPISVHEQEAGLSFKSLRSSSALGLTGHNTQIQCMVLCMDRHTCRSFYVDDGACVFGVRNDDVSDLHDGDDVTVDAHQVLGIATLRQKVALCILTPNPNPNSSPY